MKKRLYYTYDFKVGNSTVESGITRDPGRRELEHRQRWENGRLVIVGRARTEESARKWEAAKIDPFTPPRKPK